MRRGSLTQGDSQNFLGVGSFLVLLRFALLFFISSGIAQLFISQLFTCTLSNVKENFVFSFRFRKVQTVKSFKKLCTLLKGLFNPIQYYFFSSCRFKRSFFPLSLSFSFVFSYIVLLLFFLFYNRVTLNPFFLNFQNFN